MWVHRFSASCAAAGPFAQLPAGGDQPFVMGRAAQRRDRGGAADGPVGQARGADGLGGVLGDVVRHRRGGQVGAGCGQTTGAADRAGVGLGPEPHDTPQVSIDRGQLLVSPGLMPAARALSRSRCACTSRATAAAAWPMAACSSAVSNPAGGGWWSVGGGVEADDGVVVDDAAGLVFGDLDEPDPHQLVQLLAGQPGQAGQLAGDGDGEPAPQLGGQGVEQDVPGVVVAVGAQRLAQQRVSRRVGAAAGDVAAVRGSGGRGRRGGAGRAAAARGGRCGWCGPGRRTARSAWRTRTDARPR